MANLELARTEIKRVDAILRSRYNYAHPVFNHLTAALEHLEDEPPEPIAVEAEPKETVAQLKAETEEAIAVGEAVGASGSTGESEETI